MKEPVWLDERDALTLHERLLARHSGAVGVRDETVLESTLERPRQIYAYGDRPTIVGMAAAYTAGTVRKRPFNDGNNRTGFLLGVLFLELNGHHFSATEQDAAQAVLNLASGNLDEVGYANFLRVNAS